MAKGILLPVVDSLSSCLYFPWILGIYNDPKTLIHTAWNTKERDYRKEGACHQPVNFKDIIPIKQRKELRQFHIPKGQPQSLPIKYLQGSRRSDLGKPQTQSFLESMPAEKAWNGS